MRLKIKKNYIITLSHKEFGAVEWEWANLERILEKIRMAISSEEDLSSAEILKLLKEVEEALGKGALGQVLGYFDTPPF